MSWEEEYKMKKVKRKEYSEKFGLSQPDPFFGPRQVFGINSGAVRVTDPCYSLETWCAGTLENVRNGLWCGWTLNVPDDWTWEWRLDDLIEADFDPNTDTLGHEEIAETILQMFLDGKTKEEILSSEFYMTHFGQSTWVRIAVTTLDIIRDNLALEKDKHFKYLLRSIKEAETYDHDGKNPSKIYLDLQNKVCGWRQSMLTVIHEDYEEDARFSNENILETVFKLAEVSEIDVGVDSGQAGIFDLELFTKYAATKDHGDDTEEHERFYDVCCGIVCDESSYRRSAEEKKAIVISAGAVEVDGQRFGYNSSSGEGDGSYTLRIIKDEGGKVIMMNIMFMTPEEYYSEEEGEDE